MSKKRFDPFILLDIVIDPDPTEPGDETGLGPVPASPTPAGGPTSFGDWAANFGVDLNGDGNIGFDDYGQWWVEQGFGMDAWAEYNPDTPFSWSPEIDEPEI